ncbi:MAG: hypothetical protein ACT4RN_15885 [Pseudonocardia sp.]
MATPAFYHRLVPDAPRHMRTERDPVSDLVAVRAHAAKRLAFPERSVRPGIDAPTLVSSYAGSIDRLLLCLPADLLDDRRAAVGYRSLIGAMRPGTRFVVVCARGTEDTVAAMFATAGHRAENVELATMPAFLAFTDWAEDAYVAITDRGEPGTILVEPWEFPRAADVLIADAVEEFTDVRAGQAPLVFQGGNCLVGDDFWFLGADYFADTLAMLVEGRLPVVVPDGVDVAAFTGDLYAEFVDTGRRLTLVGTEKPLALRSAYGVREDDTFILDLPGAGAGTLQPIFHIDMFVTPVGRADDGRFRVLVGSPALADEFLGTSSPYAMPEVYDRIAARLAAEGFDVVRNPLAFVPRASDGTQEQEPVTLREIVAVAAAFEDAELRQAVEELRTLGAQDDTVVTVRDWTHMTWNNCLVENSESVGRTVYLPTFGHGPYAKLAALDDRMARLWEEELGFTVVRLGDFTGFAERQGVVHCIKKYLGRGA